MNSPAGNEMSSEPVVPTAGEAAKSGATDNATAPAVSLPSCESKAEVAASASSNPMTPPANAPIKRIIRQVTPINPGQKPTDTQSPAGSTTTPSGNTQKRVIRKITPIDPKKLQQAGLDRKIAEALSKQKSLQTANKTTNRILNTQTKASGPVSPTPTSTNSTAVVQTTKPSNAEEKPSPSAKPLLLAKNIIPPKITITAPEPQPEHDKPEMLGLNSQQRLEHVKNLLNKKLLQKKNSPNNDKVKTYQHLKPPPPLTGSPICAASTKSLMKPLSAKKDTPTRATPPDPRGYIVLKEPEHSTPPLKLFKAKTPQKSPQDIARKLDFQTEGELKVIHQQPAKRTYIKFNDPAKLTAKAINTPQQFMDKMPVETAANSESELHKVAGINVIPKAAIKAGQNHPQQQQLSNNLECNNFRLFDHSQQKLNSPNKISLIPTDFQQQQSKEINKIPKANIKSGHQQQQNHTMDSANFRFFPHTEQNLINSQLHEVMTFKNPYTAAHAAQVSAKVNYNQQQQQTMHQTQNFRYFQNIEHKPDYPTNVMATKSHFPTANPVHNYQNEYLKQQRITYHPKPSTADYSEIPKAAIKAGQNPQQYSYLPYSYKQLKQSEQKIDFPEVSPLKVPFPTVNVPKETPLPTIDSFKKPYPHVNAAVYYDFQAQTQNLPLNVNYESLYNNTTTSSTSLIHNNLLLNSQETNDTVEEGEAQVAESNNSPTANCLIVLENKILSQEEMIDLTELRLSNTNTPRFINPHKPIPEVVIKQEKTDEYPNTNTPPSTANTSPTSQEPVLTQIAEPKVKTAENKEIPANKVVISSGPNKKIIINAQKLKLPAAQLADLAKKIKARTAIATPGKEVSKQDIRILNTKVGNRKALTPLSAKHTAYVLPQNTAIEKDNLGISSANTNYILNNKPNYTDHNYQLKTNQNDFATKTQNKVATENSQNDLSKSSNESLIEVKEEPKTLDNNDKPQQNMLEDSVNLDASSLTDSSFSDYRKSAVEIIDEPMDTEDCFSAVDFITALNNTNPITEETSLELSPEELNLNASCTMNNFSPLRIQSYPPQRHRTTSATFKSYATNPEQMSTIVIESSKGPETILTNESPNKYGALQKVKILNNLGMCDMDLEKPHEDEASSSRKPQHLVLEPLKEPRNIDLTDVIVASDPNKIKVIISQVSQEKEKEILNSDKLASPIKVKTPRKGLQPKSQDKDKNLSKIIEKSSMASNDSTTSKEVENAASNLSIESSKSSEKVEEPKETVVGSKSPIKETLSKDSNKSTSVKIPLNLLNKDEIRSPLKVTSLKSILKSPIIDVEQHSDNSKSSEAAAITNSSSSQTASEVTKTNDTPKPSTSAGVTTKRISRFKKGKINLVQRNKAGAQIVNKPAAAEKKSEAINKINEADKEIKTKEPVEESNKEENSVVDGVCNPELNENSENKDTPRVLTKNIQSPAKSSIKTPTKSPQLELGQDQIASIENEIASEGKPNSEIAELNLTNSSGDKEEQEKVNKSNENIEKSDESMAKPTLETNVVVTEATLTDISSNKILVTKSPEKSCHKTLIAETNENSTKSPQKRKTQDEEDQLKYVSEVTPRKLHVSHSEAADDTQQGSKSPEKFPKSSEISEISTPQKSPQAIARKLDFETVKETEEVLEEEQPKGSKITESIQQKKTAQEQTKPQQNDAVNLPLEQSLFNNKQLQQTPENVISPGNTNEESRVLETPENLSEIQDNIENISYGNIATQTQLNNKNEDLDQGSRNILRNMRNAKVSLIDIVKHSPIKTPEPKPVIPFKKKTPEIKEIIPETKGIKSLIKQLKSHNKDKADKEPEEEKTKDTAEAATSNATKVTRSSSTKVNDENQNVKIVVNKRSSRLSLNEKPTTPATAKPVNTRKRHSTRPLISDDDLEFLPVNAEVKFKLYKSKHNEKDKTANTDTSTTITTPTSCNSQTSRRTRLYSKPLEMEFSKQHSSPLTKRTRYYSQTLETNVTISFDALKSDAAAPNVPSPLNRIHLKPLDTEDSCHDSTQDSSILTPTKQRKKLRKTLEDIKKSQKSHTDTDSEDERDFDDACLKDCEEGSEFLGFEENNETSFITTPPTDKQQESNDRLAKTKGGGTMKNWLTTGKAIAPTLQQEQLTKRIRHDDEEEIPATTPAATRSGSGGLKPFKKRWDLSSNRNEETDITDDTSPADDEDESAAEQISSNRKFKRGIKNVIDSNKELLDSKKLKLDGSPELGKTPEHSFIKPRHLRTISKNSGTDSESHDEKSTKAPQSRLRIRNFQESLPISANAKVADNLNETSATDSDCQERRVSRRSRCQVKDVEKTNETSGTDSDWHHDKNTKRTNSKVEAKNKTVEKHSGNSAIDSPRQDKSETRQQKSKEKSVQSAKEEKAKQSEHDSDNQGVRGSKRLQSKTNAKDANKTESSPLKSKSQNVNELDKATDKSLMRKKDEQDSESIKPKQKADDLDTSSKTLIPGSDCAKGKRSKRLKSKLVTDHDATEQNLDMPEKHNKPDNSKIKVMATKKSSNNDDSSKNEKSLPDENSSTVLECKIEESSPAIKTPQNKTSKIKTGKTKVKTEEKTLSIEDNSKQTPTSSLTRPLKRSLSTDSSDDEIPTPSAKKRSSKNQPKRKLKIEDSDSDSTATPLKKDDRHDNNIDNLTPITTPRLALVKNETPTGKVGRKRKSNAAECNFNSRLLLITKREQLETEEVLTETKPGSGNIQCGLCLGRTTKWLVHLAEHYGVGWQVGQEKLNIENRSVVLNCILNYLKSTGSKGLACRMCKKEYRSGLGILTHIESCGAQVARVICEYCERDYAPSTLPIHKRSCYAKIALENQSTNNNVEENIEKQEEVFGNTGRLKRNSTIKAENKLKVLGKELENVVDNTKSENSDIDPKSRIRYVPPLDEENITKKWSQDIEMLGKANCPKKRCKFSSNGLKELSEHLKNCKHIKSGYFCNFSPRRAFKTEKEAIEHVIKTHKGGRTRKKSDDSDCNLKTDDEQSSDDNDLSEGVDENELDFEASEEDDDCDDAAEYGKKGRKKQSKKPSKSGNQTSCFQSNRKKVYEGRSSDVNKDVLIKWKNFLKLNYSNEPLYGEFTTQYSVINQQDFRKYLPKQRISMKFNFKTEAALIPSVGEPQTNIEWSELKRYETIHNKLDTYYFLGAPVKLCSWLPLPAHVNEQYLAVVYRQDMFKFIKFTQPTQHHTVILIMKVTQNNKKPELEIYYGFVVPDGPVHHVSFLPSGGYDKSSNRLGLIAVATVSPTIKIYSLPLNVEKKVTSAESSNNNKDITLIEIKPSFLLNLDLIQQQQHVLFDTQCLQTCWSEFAGHQHIFASFANGFIGIWDITNDQQNLNRFEANDVINFAPLNYFYVGEKRVKCFALHYDTSGPRWLAVSGAYRKFLIFDIKSFMQPIVMKEEVNKNILLSMDWCPVWETLLYSYCDAIPNNGRCVMAVNPTNIMFPQNKLDFMVCGVTQIHYTPLTNMCVSALDNGDVVFLDTRELHYEHPVGKKFGERRMLYAMDVKQLDGKPLAKLTKGNEKNVSIKVPTDWSMHDDNYKEKYGLVFQPLLKLKEEYKNNYLSEQRCPPTNIIPLMRINTLRCNLNSNAKNLIVMGYENGFLRFVNFNKEKDML